jgi:hypothetical protein
MGELPTASESGREVALGALVGLLGGDSDIGTDMAVRRHEELLLLAGLIPDSSCHPLTRPVGCVAPPPLPSPATLPTCLCRLPHRSMPCTLQTAMVPRCRSGP